jgi:uncharacterized protein YeaC (DUF1315 family)
MMMPTLNKMNPQVKQKWIDALRSGKYEQGSEKLRGANGYCCLGVLCDLYAQEHNTQWEFRGYDENGDETNPHPMDYWYFEDRSEFLPESVMDWAGLKTPNPSVRVYCEDSDDEDTRYYTDEIANVNDSGYTFNDLSKIIQEQL